jgi:hypothetical protein
MARGPERVAAVKQRQLRGSLINISVEATAAIKIGANHRQPNQERCRQGPKVWKNFGRKLIKTTVKDLILRGHSEGREALSRISYFEILRGAQNDAANLWTAT